MVAAAMQMRLLLCVRFRASIPLEKIEYGVDGDIHITYPKPCSIQSRGTIGERKLVIHRWPYEDYAFLFSWGCVGPLSVWGPKPYTLNPKGHGLRLTQYPHIRVLGTLKPYYWSTWTLRAIE